MLISKTIRIGPLPIETRIQVIGMNWYPTGNQNRPIEVSIRTKVINQQADPFKNLQPILQKSRIPNLAPGHQIQNQVPNQVPNRLTQSRVQGQIISLVHDHQIPDPAPGLLPPGLAPDLQQPEGLRLEAVIQEQDINNIFNF